MSNFMKRFIRDEEGASLVEYTVLIGIITVGVIVTIGLVGDWMATQWTTLNTTIRS
jgi:pilus assembly protein Flp/PilA